MVVVVRLVVAARTALQGSIDAEHKVAFVVTVVERLLKQNHSLCKHTYTITVTYIHTSIHEHTQAISRGRPRDDNHTFLCSLNPCAVCSVEPFIITLYEDKPIKCGKVVVVVVVVVMMMMMYEPSCCM